MHRYKSAARLGLLFVLVVMVPCVFLALLAARAINREEAYIEKRLEGTLLAEVTHVATLVDAELKKILEELLASAPSGLGESSGDFFPEWKAASSLVSVPFLLSPENEILRPNYNQDLSDEELSFLNWNRAFLTGQVSIPVYKNIALVYKDEIINRLDKSYNEQIANQEAMDRQAISQEVMNQQAISQFEQDESIRKKVYQQAKEKGQAPLSRTVNPSAKVGLVSAESKKQESVFISEKLTFNEIAAQAEHGVIPRLIDDRLILLFWARDEEGNTVGCVIDEEELHERIISLLPNVYSPVRILTVLDEHGRPLVTPTPAPGEEERDWRRPFVAREISETLPRWEVAAYLTDPGIISSRASFMALIMWALIVILFVSIAGGGGLVLKTLQNEMNLARQKTTFVANVSHELKTPLTSIRMFAEMLREKRQPDKKKQRRYLDLMVSETERLTRLINNVLDFSQLEQDRKSYTLKVVDIVRLTENMLESQRVRFEHNGFEVHFSCDDRPLKVKADEDAIKQTLLNLLSNAEKYSEARKVIEIVVSQEENHALIDIKDRGKGIPPKHAGKIFKEFYRVDDSLTARVRGTGLGLSISLRIIRDHNGEILYFPRDEGGSVFQVKLPLAEE